MSHHPNPEQQLRAEKLKTLYKACAHTEADACECFTGACLAQRIAGGHPVETKYLSLFEALCQKEGVK